jgi:hypothetical protein
MNDNDAPPTPGADRVSLPGAPNLSARAFAPSVPAGGASDTIALRARGTTRARAVTSRR